MVYINILQYFKYYCLLNYLVMLSTFSDVCDYFPGARGQYVDVFADQSSTKPTPVAPSNLFTVLPKSASVPTKLFVPSSKSIKSALS